jgi:hypothetical protein
MKHPQIMVIVSLVALAFVACKPTHVLKYDTAHLKPGSKYDYKQRLVTEMSFEVMGKSKDTYEQVTKHMTFDVLKTNPDGSFVLDCKTYRLQKLKNEDGKVTEYDTNDPNPSGDLELDIAKRVAGIPLELSMRSSGECTQIKGVDSVWNATKEAINDEPMAEKMLDGMASQLNEGFFKSSMNEIFYVYPDKPVKVGSKWKIPIDYKILSTKGYSEQTLQSVTPDSIVIRSKTSYRFNPKSPGELKIGPVKIVYKMNGEGTGVTVTDRPSGLPRKVSYEMTFAGDMDVTVPFAGSQTLPCKMKITGDLIRKK